MNSNVNYEGFEAKVLKKIFSDAKSALVLPFWCAPAETFGNPQKEKPAISLRQRALFWLREPDLN
jgi:hypothetical protein